MLTFELKLPPGVNKISALPPHIQANVVKALEAGMKLAGDKAIRSYLTGPRPERLGVVTGRLRAGVFSKASRGTPGEIFATGVLGVSNIIYSWIHELGGTTRPHVIQAKSAPYLAFYWEKIGRWVRFKKVNHPGSKMPARPYLDYAIRMTKPKIESLIGLAVDKAHQEV
jgi:hypothetical protein